MKRKGALSFAALVTMLCFLIVTNTFARQNKKVPVSNAEYQSYLAHIAAANASLRLNETAEAKRWLAAAPAPYRNWEWRYLNARTDNSVAKIDNLDAKPDEVHYSPDGKMLIAAMPDNSIRLFDAESLKEVKRLTGHKGAVYAAKFSPDGSRVVSCSRDTTIALWNLATGNMEWQVKGGGFGLADVDVSPDGKSVAYCSWYLKNRGVVGIVSLWEVDTAKEIWRANFATHPLVDIRFSPDGKRLAVGTWEWRVGVWNLEKKEEPPVVFHFPITPMGLNHVTLLRKPLGRLLKIKYFKRPPLLCFACYAAIKWPAKI